MTKPRRTVLAICGATASGKSSVAERVADRLNGRAVLIVADSRKVYRGLTIGAAKPSAERRRRYRYEMLDLIDLNEHFTAFRFAEAAKQLVAEAFARDDIPLIVGGTGFYLHSLIEGIFEAPPIPTDVRDAIVDRTKREGWGWAYDELSECDPETAKRIHPSDQTRILRSLETWHATGITIGEWMRGRPAQPAPFDVEALAIERPREELYDRINQRAFKMLEDGLIDEVRSLLEQGYDEHAPGFRSVGYAEVLLHLAGRASREECLERIRRNTRRYAKRQLTWFRHRDYVNWLDSSSALELTLAAVRRAYPPR